MPLVLPVEPEGRGHVYHQYVVRTAQRDALRHHLSDAGIGTAILYPQPIHLQDGYRERVAIGAGGLAESERAAREILCLPVYPELSEAQVDEIVTAVRGFFAV